MPVRGSGGLVSSWSLLIRGILAALRQKLHLSTCPNLASQLYSRHLAVAWHVLPTVPGVPLRIDLGGDGHTANLQHRRHATLRHFYAVRVNLLPFCAMFPSPLRECLC